MKLKHIFLAGVVGLSGITTSCLDLDEKIYSNIVSEDFEPTEDDLLGIISPTYTKMRDVLFAWHGAFDMQEECSDIIVTPGRPNGWEDGGVYRNMHEHNWNSEQSHIGGYWNNNYAGINFANRSIYQIENGELTIAEDLKASTLGELRAMRALYYYNLLDNFRSVAFIDKYDVPDDYLPEQIDAKGLFEYIEKELKESIPVLTDVVDQTTYGRMTKYGAQFLLARLYLNAEVYLGTARWQECITLCNEIMADGKYQLEPDFRDIFKTNNENSVEIIFAVPFDDIYAGWFHLHMKTLHPQNQKTYQVTGDPNEPWGGNCAIPQFIDTYDPEDGRLYDTWIIGQQYDSGGNELYCSIDPSRSNEKLIYTNTCPGIVGASESDGYRIGKFEISTPVLTQLSNDFPLFRYADVYMMKAECLLRTGDAGGAAALVTEVRRRNFSNPAKATITAAELESGSSYNYGYVENGVIVEPQGGADIQYGRFLDELGWEFAAEAHRRMDLVRFGVFTTKKWLSKQRINQPYRNYFPIPQSALAKNPNLKQHADYSSN